MSALLKALGGRTDALVHLDFESYYDADYSLRKLTTEGYVRDPRFEAIGVGVRLGDQPSVWLEEWDFRAWAKRVDWARVALNAHHAQFDAFILSHHYGIKPGFLTCTMSMARALHGTTGVGLEKLAAVYGLGEKGKELALTKGKRRADFTQTDWLRFGEYCRQDVDLTAGLLKAMRVGFPREELWQIDTKIRMFTEPVFVANQVLLESALIEERAKKAALLERVAESAGAGGAADVHEAARMVLSSSDKFAALLVSMGETPPTKQPNDKGESIYAFAKTDPGMQALLEHQREEIRFLAEARQSVKSTITETRVDRILGIAKRGAVPMYLKYCGAHTHRDSGGDKMNPQNFNRGGVLRDAFEAPEGHVICVADSGQIEARVLPWLAGQANLLETFRRNDLSGGDFYSDVGGEFFRMKLSKKETPIERQLAKNMILGLGFGMGWIKFAGELLKGMLGSDPVQFTQKDADQYRVDALAFGARQYGPEGDEICCADKVRAFGARLDFEPLLIHCAVADYFVRLYRTNNSRIVGLWRAMDSVLKAMESPGGDPNEVRLTFRGLKVINQGIVKPGGLVMRYPGLRRGPGGYSYLGGPSGREHTKVYGGLLVENVVQSLARDVVFEQALWIRADGYPVKMMTHDENVSVVPKAQGQQCLDAMLARMRVPPAWCADLPLNAAGGFARSYGAVK